MSVDGREFEMHRLVQFATKKWLELYGELEEWEETFVGLMDGNYLEGRHENRMTCRMLFPHVRAMKEYRPSRAEALQGWASVLFKVAWYASEMGQYEVAKEMGFDALEARKATLGGEHPDTLNSMNGIALVLKRQGDYEAAEAMNRRALEGREKVLEKEHPSTLTSVYNLAYLLGGLRRYDEALPLYQRASSGYSQTLGSDHPTTRVCLCHQASLQQ
jgi:tetratricopeptide (TPR) repeat protein